MNYMVIDIGSNTVKYDVFSIRKGAVTLKHKRTVGLGFIGYVFDGSVTKEGLQSLIDILNSFSEDAEEYKCRKIFALATASFRSLDDPDKVISEVFDATGVKIRLVDGAEEAKLSLEGLFFSGDKITDGVMIDMGGGSTEVVVFSGKKETFSISLPFGALSLRKAFCPGRPCEGKGAYASAGELEKIREFAFECALKSGVPKTPFDGYIIGGSGKAISKLLKENNDDAPVRLTSEKLLRLACAIAGYDDREAEELKKCFPERHLVISTAAAALSGIIDSLGIKGVISVDGGVRTGYIVSLLKEGKVK